MIYKNVSVNVSCLWNPTSRLLQIGHKLGKWQCLHNLLTWRHHHLGVNVFLLSSLVTGPSFMSISLLVLESWQFSFIKDWPETRKSEIPPYGFYSISGGRGKLGTPNLVLMFLMKCYWMLQNTKVTAFTVPELLRENQQRK